MMASNSAREPRERPKPNEKLVKVFDTEQESEAMIVRGLLESSGIDADITSLDAQQDILPGVGGTIILVREEDAPEARRVIEEYRQSPANDDTAEVDIVEDVNEPPER
jgi:hypothetical protein